VQVAHQETITAAPAQTLYLQVSPQTAVATVADSNVQEALVDLVAVGQAYPRQAVQPQQTKVTTVELEAQALDLAVAQAAVAQAH